MKFKTSSLTRALALGLSIAAGAAGAATVIVADNFGGLISANLGGTTADTFDPAIAAAGGSATWSGSAFFKADGSVVVTNSTGIWRRSAHLNLGSYLNNAKGTSDGTFQLTMTVAGPPPATGFLSIGYSALNTPAVTGDFTTAALDAVGTIAYRNTGVIDAYGGLATANPVTDGSVTATGDRTLTITLDLTGHNGVDNFGSVSFSDSVLGSLGTHAYTQNRNFGSILLTVESPAFTPATMGQYGSLTLTQIPEPAAAFLGGLGLLAMMRRRRAA